MKVKSLLFAFLLVVIIILIALNVALFYRHTTIASLLVTGRATDTSQLGITIPLQNSSVNITVPFPNGSTIPFIYTLNTTGSYYPVQLNLTATYNIHNYLVSLYDLRHDTWAYQNEPWTTNETIWAVRWDNRVFVLANLTDDQGAVTAQTDFFVTVTNTAPILQNISDQEVCVGSSLNTNFTVQDAEETDENITASITPTNPFFVSTNPFLIAGNESTFSLFSGSLNSSFEGDHVLQISVNDGTYSDSQNVTVTVLASSHSSCTTPSGSGDSSSSGGGGGGGGGSSVCTEKWGCEDWFECQHTLTSYLTGAISIEDYAFITQGCMVKGYTNETCGFQLRECFEVNDCSYAYTAQEPSKLQSCHYTADPSCSDDILNCHDGLCEILTDCGGPCSACATCSDGIQNQGEIAVDCGGPCPFGCEPESPLGNGPFVVISLLTLIIILTYIIEKLYPLLLLYFEKEPLGNLKKRFFLYILSALIVLALLTYFIYISFNK